MYRSRLRTTLPEVRERIGAAAQSVGREPADVRIVAVTKGHNMDAVEAAIAEGLRDLGENRLEELEQKVKAVPHGESVRWHVVGHVQRRKAAGVWNASNLFHALDSVRLAERLQRVAPEGIDPLPVLLQVNVSGEASKGGFSPGTFMEDLRQVLELSALEVRGLMTMAPFTDDEDVIRRTFRGLRNLHEEARGGQMGYRGNELSMGMSNDFEVAVEEGSTIVRLGTVLLGERPE